MDNCQVKTDVFNLTICTIIDVCCCRALHEIIRPAPFHAPHLGAARGQRIPPVSLRSRVGMTRVCGATMSTFVGSTLVGMEFPGMAIIFLTPILVGGII